MTEELLPIGRFARACGLSIGALRHYDELGLLAPASVNPETGYRSYTRSQLGQARLIAHLRELEMPLPEIRAVLAAEPGVQKTVLEQHRSRMEARTMRLQRIVHQLSKEMPMPPTLDELLDSEAHRSLAVALFNHTWTLLEIEERTPAQDDEMIHAAHASRFHWSRARDAREVRRLAVGEWQCSRVYSVLGRGEPALFHARRAMTLAESGDVEDWVYAAACEAMARASRVAGDRAAFEHWRSRATEATAAISEEDERLIIEGDLATLGA